MRKVPSTTSALRARTVRGNILKMHSVRDKRMQPVNAFFPGDRQSQTAVKERREHIVNVEQPDIFSRLGQTSEANMIGKLFDPLNLMTPRNDEPYPTEVGKINAGNGAAFFELPKIADDSSINLVRRTNKT